MRKSIFTLLVLAFTLSLVGPVLAETNDAPAQPIDEPVVIVIGLPGTPFFTIIIVDQQGRSENITWSELKRLYGEGGKDD